MLILAQSMGAWKTSFVNRLTSAKSLGDDAPGNQAGMKASIGNKLIKDAFGTRNSSPRVTLLSAPVTNGSSIDITSYPYIVFIGIETDNLY